MHMLKTNIKLKIKIKEHKNNPVESLVVIMITVTIGFLDFYVIY